MIVNDGEISEILKSAEAKTPAEIRAILKKARGLKGINAQESAALLCTRDKTLLNEIFETAKFIKTQIYGNRLVLFAPLYISNICFNECVYCAFRASNKELERKALNQEEIKAEILQLLRQGHKRVLMVAGESYSGEGLKYIFDSIKTIYSVQGGKNNIRRVNVNIAPLTVEEFKELAKYNIGTFQLFQETYHKPTYEKLHIAGKKKDYDFRLNGMHRAFEAGFKDVGIGALLGLYDYKYEVLAMLQHIKSLEETFGVGPHTISVPRVEPACGSSFSENPPYAVADEDFKKIIAVLRISVPYTGIILSTRESAAMRSAALELGISQLSGGSRIDPGGYEGKEAVGTKKEFKAAQFSLGDHRTLAQVIEDIVAHGYIPSFCTGCYRLGRVGKDFMDLAKPGLIKIHCLPNAMFTFAEYLYDFAGGPLKAKGFALINKMMADLPPATQQQAAAKLEEIKNGRRDIYF
ncbi:MAG: [FeFe] hydrogenase H-cluster radical SAM maturase HydG [Elusimicrobiota bacterium]|jgi:2-iminoacetate synthase|nr:[FeFe] hydrogenase H-cluster radical SAM maturase HydG [Elusimicrobiota bacterium]